MSSSAKDWPTYTVTLSNGRTIKVTAPSEQRALHRVNKMIEQRGSSVTVISVR
jgi:hypothetical protein